MNSRNQSEETAARSERLQQLEKQREASQQKYEQSMKMYGILRQFQRTNFNFIAKQSSIAGSKNEQEIDEASRLSDMPFILKSKRIEYIFEKSRRMHEGLVR